ncbi:hypothetical protein [Legionella sp. PC997]|uniref:hypothetical protein n=1 Tax=Legionella sp. PC997 TaxID=2755562 RepID=UPI0015FA8C46|nr:hypothetical protein [Legionella sp. PC997]QMT59802.1 hypothetical protein HBNCFIEN_01169 [Legionella sp. PC997]
MKKSFFSEPNQEKNKTHHFLQHFPCFELWRFFVERSRYDDRQFAYDLLIKSLEDIKINFHGAYRILNREEIMEYLDTVKLNELYQLATRGFSLFNLSLLNVIIHFFKFEEQDQQLLKDYIEMRRAWTGFEQSEPGYLLGMAHGFAFILKKLHEPDAFDIEFIKSLHATCTAGVKNLFLMEREGEFRKSSLVGWTLNSQQNTYEGIFEILLYMQTPECKGLSFIDKSGKVLASTRDKNFDSKEKAVLIWNMLTQDQPISIRCLEMDEKIVDVERYLNEVCYSHLMTYRKEIGEANSKYEKLTAIFKFIKYTVLHHPFSDGVGRTFSMLLTFYLLMLNNLLPVILKNSNNIPGWSVKEMVEEYLSLEKEMKEVLRNPSYLSSDIFAPNNIDTVAYLKQLPETPRSQFYEAVEIMQNAIQLYNLENQYNTHTSSPSAGIKL